jgi:hypothetical protein
MMSLSSAAAPAVDRSFTGWRRPGIRCDAFDGFPCLLNGKADAQVICVDPTLKAYPNLTLLTGAYVSKLETSESGTTVTNVHVTKRRPGGGAAAVAVRQ